MARAIIAEREIALRGVLGASGVVKIARARILAGIPDCGVDVGNRARRRGVRARCSPPITLALSTQAH